MEPQEPENNPWSRGTLGHDVWEFDRAWRALWLEIADALVGPMLRWYIRRRAR